ncbi:hypothetical protein [Dyadobacter sp. OTU695]|uniref:hypothetical protein n=1 Tax=Dyadobacter sp. OTU695 TaxID=3043860 RepID=UPI00313DFB79
MKFEVEALPNFEKEAKRLKKKFNSLGSELLDLIEQLEIDPFIGTALPRAFIKSGYRSSLREKGSVAERG